MNINLQGKNIELTDAIKEYALKKVTNLEKILSKIEAEGENAQVFLEVGKSTNHHKAGEFFHADCSVTIKGEHFYASSDKENLYESIDEVKENLFRKIERKKNRSRDLFRRGAKSVKKMMKGLSKRNPFTSKY